MESPQSYTIPRQTLAEPRPARSSWSGEATPEREGRTEREGGGRVNPMIIAGAIFLILLILFAIHKYWNSSGSKSSMEAKDVKEKNESLISNINKIMHPDGKPGSDESV